MATPSRPWFRLPSLVLPAPAPIPALAPEPAPAQPRPPLVRPTFRPIAQPQPTQPQELTPPPPATALPQTVTSVIVAPLALASDVAAPVPTQASTSGVDSVPPPPPSASAPSATSPAVKTSPIRTVLPLNTTTSSVPPSPKPRASTPSSSVPSSPTPKAAPATSMVPTSPATKALSTSPVKTMPPSNSVTTSPIPRIATTTADTTTTITSPLVPVTTTGVRNPTPSPKHIKPVTQTPPVSPKLRHAAPPPSPLILPPSQIKSDVDHQPEIPLEAEQKNVLVKKTIEKSKAWIHGSDSQIKPDVTHNAKKEVGKDGRTKGKGQPKKFSSDSEDGGMRVITIAGENKGAFMEVTLSTHKKHGFEGNPHYLHKNVNPRTSSGDERQSYSTSSDEEGSSRMKDKTYKTMATPLPTSAFMNCNVQGVNNSIVYNSSCTHHDPGVHVAFSRKPSNGGFLVKDPGNGRH
ncbi:hypothetical protein CFOL_v3_17989 [Cephalotus follicularis]|uniref:Uncharacterized protein n=1 Tax=Cephalotus follicularis TaxID=3775 RepID=A0A1Q3C2U8_CEPFO|nr:hypothetical protein CFOL_v3_17989 [Cephalotus follicularis]